MLILSLLRLLSVTRFSNAQRLWITPKYISADKDKINLQCQISMQDEAYLDPVIPSAILAILSFLSYFTQRKCSYLFITVWIGQKCALLPSIYSTPTLKEISWNRFFSVLHFNAVGSQTWLQYHDIRNSNIFNNSFLILRTFRSAISQKYLAASGGSSGDWSWLYFIQIFQLELSSVLSACRHFV